MKRKQRRKTMQAQVQRGCNEIRRALNEMPKAAQLGQALPASNPEFDQLTSRLASGVERTNQLRYRVGAIVERLLGPTPTKATPTDDHPSPPYFVSRMHDLFNRGSNDLDVLEELVATLERTVGN